MNIEIGNLINEFGWNGIIFAFNVVFIGYMVVSRFTAKRQKYNEVYNKTLADARAQLAEGGVSRYLGNRYYTLIQKHLSRSDADAQAWMTVWLEAKEIEVSKPETPPASVIDLNKREKELKEKYSHTWW